MTDPVPSKDVLAVALTSEQEARAEQLVYDIGQDPYVAHQFVRVIVHHADEIEHLRRENVRWENAHKILIAENERLQRQVTELSIHAEKWVKRALGSVPEPAAMRALWNKAVIVQSDNRATVAFETAEEAEAAFDYLQEIGNIEQPEPEPEPVPLTWETFWQKVREINWTPSPDDLRKILNATVINGAGTSAPACVTATNGFGITAMWCAVCGSKEGEGHLVGCPYAGASQPPGAE